MPRSTFLLPLLASVSLAALACGGTVQSSSEAGGTGSGGAASTTGSATSGTTGTGAGSTAVSSSSGTSSTTGGLGGAGGQGACGTGAPRHDTTNCATNTQESTYVTAVGWYSANPAAHTEALEIVGCASDASGAEGITLTADDASGVGSYATGTTQFTDAQGKTWGMAGDPFSLTVTSSDGTAIRGSFMVTASGADLVGTFDVCHGSDFLPP
jgi:hypothetical protein